MSEWDCKSCSRLQASTPSCECTAVALFFMLLLLLLLLVSSSPLPCTCAISLCLPSNRGRHSTLRCRRYYTPSILQLAGVSNQAALLLAMLPALTNALGTVVGMHAIDRAGRRRLLLASIAAVAVALAALGSAFLAAERNSPAVLTGSSSGSSGGGSIGSSTCPAAAADCTACLRQGCGFCGGAAGNVMAPGACLSLAAQHTAEAECGTSNRLFLHGCPSRHPWLILFCLVAYLAAFSPGAVLLRDSCWNRFSSSACHPCAGAMLIVWGTHVALQ